MDQNKLKKLREIGYEITFSCSHCEYSNFKKGLPWGICILHEYKHFKHTGDNRELSIYRYGRCDDIKVLNGMENYGNKDYEEFVQ